jgi:hypothetical protein
MPARDKLGTTWTGAEPGILFPSPKVYALGLNLVYHILASIFYEPFSVRVTVNSAESFSLGRDLLSRQGNAGVLS